MIEAIKILLPEEACGLLAGKNNISTQVYPIENILHSPVKFLMEPKQQLNALLEIEQKGWELLAIYHSHPRGPNKPSETDILEYYYPDTPCLIWSGGEAGWTCRGFLIQDQKIRSIRVETIE